MIGSLLCGLAATMVGEHEIAVIGPLALAHAPDHPEQADADRAERGGAVQRILVLGAQLLVDRPHGRVERAADKAAW